MTLRKAIQPLNSRLIHTRFVSTVGHTMSAGPLTKTFGKELWTPYSGNALNRLSFLREDTEYLHNAFHAPDALFLPFLKFDPLLERDTKLHWLKLQDIASIVGDPYKHTVADRAKAWDPAKDASGASEAQVVFLGVDESKPSSGWDDKGYPGAPRFAFDITAYEQATPELRERLAALEARIKSNEDLEFRSVIFGVTLEDPMEFSVIAEAKIILDWINRTRFCAGCGRRNMSVWGGFKLLCPTSFTGATQCPTNGRITNLSFPRTDCCVIVAVVSHDGSRTLVGRSRRFRGNMYSCLAGFLESGESIEDCVRREVFEEAGVKVGRVVMVASQPWPYPSNIMIGCIAEVADASEESHKIHLEHDKELADARWVSKSDMHLMCRDEGDFDISVPPSSSIAWVLLDAASNGTF